ncbi:MAG: EAL domain-containing protein [Lachnospiraceae bacterium]|nr:EAL domain-containing protein [Lachnospiraceae bacterium]
MANNSDKLKNKAFANASAAFDFDYLTGLASRRGLHDYYYSLDKNTIVHAMFIDIDNFKRVNDIYGHSMGDQLLIGISELIKSNTQGFTSRIGGDEYVVLFDGTIPAEEMSHIAEQLLAGMAHMDYRKDVLSLISLSIGIVLEQPVSQSLDDVLAKCDAAMYQAKYDGKNRYTVYKAFDKTIETNRNIELEMEPALANGEFHVYLQPKVNMITSELYGAEALSRWVHPIDGVRAPIVYIPLFEKNGFISQLDMYVYEEVCRIKASWTGKRYEHIPISVNMSRLHLYHRDFPETLRDIANRYNVPTNELEIEITESIFIKDHEELIHTVDHLRELGFLVSIDDFGSGFSALNLLKDLAVDTVKLDKQFLQVSSNTFRGKKVIRNVIALCRDLKLDVVTEGIETQEHVDFIISCGCPIAQGFYYAKPLPLEEFLTFADEHTSNIRENYTFRFNGDLQSEDKTLTASIFGDGDITFQEGIFKDSKAVHFPGGPVETNTVRIPPVVLSNDSYTISMWIKPETIHAWTAVFYVKFETGFCAIIPYAWDSVSDFRIRDSKEVNGWYDVSSAPLLPNRWVHYVATYNAKTESTVTFINGEVVGILQNVPTNRFAKSIIIGGDVFQPSFVGSICELVIYNEPKDFDFISELHQSYVQNPEFIAIMNE